MSDAQTAETLRSAGRWLDGHGWIRNYLTDVQEKMYEAGDFGEDIFTGAQHVCARGAIMIVSGVTEDSFCFDNALFQEADQVLQEYLIRHDMTEYDDVAFWNNEEAESKEDVVKAMFAAADELVGV